MSTSIPTPQFMFGDGEAGAPNTIMNIAKLDAYIVAYKDGAGKDATRVCLRVQNSNTTFVLQERINGVNVVTSTHDWFNKALTDKLQDLGVEKSDSSESVGSV